MSILVRRVNWVPNSEISLYLARRRVRMFNYNPGWFNWAPCHPVIAQVGPPYFSTSALFIFAGLLRSDPLSGHFRTPIRATILRYSSLRRTVVLPCSNFINWSGPTKFTDEGFDNARQMPFMFYERILTVTSPTQPHRWVLHVNCVLYTKAKLHLVFFYCLHWESN